MQLRIPNLPMALFIVLFVNPFGMAQFGDPNGWSKAKWGMTEKEIAKAFAGEVRWQNLKGSRGLYSTIEIPKTEIGRHYFSVSFWMDSVTNRLAEVTLSSQHNPPNENSHLNMAVFSNLEGMLIAKYGPPANKEDRKDLAALIRERTWLFPTTVISLTYFQVDALHILSFQYQLRSTKGSDKI